MSLTNNNTGHCRQGIVSLSSYLDFSNYISHTEQLYKIRNLLKINDSIELQQLKCYQNYRIMFKYEAHSHDI